MTEVSRKTSAEYPHDKVKDPNPKSNIIFGQGKCYRSFSLGTFLNIYNIAGNNPHALLRR